MSGGLYGIDDTEMMGTEDKLPLDDSPVISALDCPSLSNATAFSLLADDSQTSASIFASAASPPVLGESVVQGKRGEEGQRGLGLGKARGQVPQLGPCQGV